MIPPAISVDILSDRTETIRASVEDVEFTLAHHHRPRGAGDPPVPAQSARHGDPGLVVPLSLLGAAAVMYSPDSASTISR